MDIGLRVGNGIECEYSGTIADVLVKLKCSASDGTVPAGGLKETGWLSRKALEDALKVIGSLDSGPVSPERVAVMPQVALPVASVPQSSAQPWAPAPPVGASYPPREAQAAPPPPSKPMEVPVEVLQNFDRELVRLIRLAEQEEPEDGKKKGVKEIELRELVMKFRPTFGKQGSAFMYRILNTRLGLARDRFEMMWAQKPEREIQDEEE